MIWQLILIVVLFAYPFWLFIKLARYGKGFLRPDFNRMQRKINEWTGFYQNGTFSYNRPAGKIVYYLLLLYVFSIIPIIIYCLAK
ncbi:MAG: hypothetical protein LBO74_16870 [Candidatus Symbiothrix sp.]|jgi:hypothetical protein|nr:hypothetical protein [Candidatus Symbiothrix sp.]